MQTREVILVILQVLERRETYQIYEFEVSASHLVYGHFPRFERRAFYVLSQVPNHQLSAERILRRQSSRIDSLKSIEKCALCFEIRLMKLWRMVTQTVVIAIVTDGSCHFRMCAQLILPFFLEQG